MASKPMMVQRVIEYTFSTETLHVGKIWSTSLDEENKLKTIKAKVDLAVLPLLKAELIIVPPLQSKKDYKCISSKRRITVLLLPNKFLNFWCT